MLTIKYKMIGTYIKEKRRHLHHNCHQWVDKKVATYNKLYSLNNPKLVKRLHAYRNQNFKTISMHLYNIQTCKNITTKNQLQNPNLTDCNFDPPCWQPPVLWCFLFHFPASRTHETWEINMKISNNWFIKIQELIKVSMSNLNHFFCFG